MDERLLMLAVSAFLLALAAVFVFRYRRLLRRADERAAVAEAKIAASQKEAESKVAALQKALEAKEKDSEFAAQWKDAPAIKAENIDLREQIKILSGLLDKEYDRDDSPFMEKLRDSSFSLLDAKCEDELEKAILLCDALIRSGSAVEPVEQGAQIAKGAAALLLSSFNGEADALIAGLSYRSSYEKARQDIALAYYMTNERGRNTLQAVIAKRYFEAKLDVLRWTLAVNEYRRALREEDRNRREAERDEARALQELQKKAEEARRERIMYEKALQEARKELSRVFSPQERMRLENRVRELEAQLAAKADEEHTLTAAQQGRRGTVYVISNVGSFGENVYKIGMTRRLDPQVRVSELNEASTPYPFDVHAFIQTEDAPSLELELHKRYQGNKLNLVANSNAREFFRLNLPELRAYIESRGYRARWRMEAEAREYRESEKMRGEIPSAAPEKLSSDSARISQGLKNGTALVPRSNAVFPAVDDLMAALRDKGIEMVDKRGVGGCLWIASSDENDAFLKNVTVAGKRLGRTPKSRHFKGAPGWFIA